MTYGVILAFEAESPDQGGQGETLHHEGNDRIGEREEIEDRIRVDEAALERLEDLAEEDWGRGYRRAHAQPLQLYRRNRFAARSDGAADGDPDGIEERSSSYQRLMLELPHAQRLTLVRLCKRVASATRPCTA